MCGIAGYFQVSASGQPCNPEQLKQATATLHHRGPDDNGIWTGQDRQAGLGHTRLSILDLSRHGHQPMFSEDGRFVLVFNGEIYNYREIRKELRGKGFEFDSDCDTEVLLKAFQVWGTDCVQRFIGMFAFAIWDKRQKKLLLCRDRVGVKPLYYGWDGRVVCFASELKALLEFKHWQPEINRQALGEFLQYGYIAAPRSTYQQVNKLLPGHWLEISTTAPHPRLSRYWSLQDVVAKGPMEVNAEEDLADELEALLVDAFKYRMIADVPVGVFLSGGIDSSIVAALLQKHSDRVIHTFTIGFDDKSHDEPAWARKIADHLGTRHTEHILDLDKAREIIPRLPEIYDEPFGDSSGIPTAMVSTLARQEVTVALSADGGDELFGGYNSYVLNPARLHAIASQSLWLRKFAGMGLAALPDSILSKGVGATAAFGSALPSKLLRKLIKLRHVLPKATPSSVYQASQAHFMPAEIKRLIGGYEDPRRPAEAYSGAFAKQMTQWDFEYYLPDDILVKVDRATMSVGLEGREPLLDHRLVEFAFRLPLEMRIGALGQKHLLRKLLYRHVPRELIDRPKQGFAIPINRWLRENDAGLVRDLASDESAMATDLDMQMIGREVTLLRKAGVNETRVWLLFVLAQWMAHWQS